MADRAGKPSPGRAVRIRYAVLGLIAAGLWLWGGGQPLWLHAVRMLAILLIVPAVASRVVAAIARRRGRQMTETISIGRLVAVKAGLISIALAVTALLGHRVADLDVYVAAWLALMLAVGGPAIHYRLLVEVIGGQHPHRRRARPLTGFRPSRERRQPRRRLRFLLAVGLAACLALAGVAEIVAEHVISHRISAAAGKRLTGPISVSIGATPALADAISGHISEVTIHAPSTTMCNLRNVTAEATLTDVHRSHGRIAVQGVSAEMTLTAQTFAGLFRGTNGAVTVTADPSAGVLRIGIGPGGLLQVEETAQLHGDTIQFSPVGMSLYGRSVPAGLQGMITSRLTVRRTLSGLPLNLTPRSVTITGAGLQVGLVAGPAIVNGTGSARTCATP
jgi:hypothetical protein